MPHFLIISLLLFLVSAFTQPVWAYDASHYATGSCLAQGHWVKVAVDTTGIHQISYDTLRGWGFDDPSRVTVHGYGAARGALNNFGDYPDDLPVQHSLHTEDGRLLFYAEGSVTVTAANTGAPKVIRNYYSDRSYYFLTDSYSAPETQAIEYVANPGHQQDYALFVDFREKETRNYGEGGALFHGPEITAGNPDSYTFRVQNLAQGDVTVRLSGIIRLATTSTRLKPEFEGPVGKVNFSAIGIQPVISDNKIWTTFTASGSLSASADHPMQDAPVTMTLAEPEGFTGVLLALDHVTLIYRRTLRLEPGQAQLQSQIPLQPVRNLNLVYTDTPEQFHVWDVSTPWQVQPYDVHTTATGAVVTAPYRPNTSTRLVAFDASATFAEPEFAGDVAAQNLHGVEVPDMVVITTPLFLDAAQDLASVHRSRGMDVLVVLQSDIFNEFGSGAPSAAAIRRFNKMCHDRDTGKDKFRFVTIYGAATWDPRHLTADWPDFPLAYLAEESTHAQESAANFSNDAYFGILSDVSSTETIARLKMDVAVGRIPARTAGDGIAYNNKLRAHLAAPPSPAVYLRAITTSGDGDNFQHFDHNTALTDTLYKYNPLLFARRADELLYPERVSGKESDATRAIVDALRQGSGFLSYCGHANPQAFGNYLWDLRTTGTYSYARYPLAMFATCYVIPFDRFAAIGERMLFKPGGGVIGAIGACRSVYLDRNKTLSYAVARAYAGARPGTTMGEVFSNARAMLVDKGMTGQLGANTMCYNYIGDPSVPLCIPEGTIVVDTMFGSPIEGGEMVAPGIICTIAGHVENPDGSLMSDFNGELTLDMYRAPQNVATRVQQGLQRFPKLESEVLSTFTSTISGGRFTASLTMPVSDAPWIAVRTLMTASDATTGKPVAGVMVGPGIGSQYVHDTQAAPAPEIELLEVDEGDFNPDGTVAPRFALNVSIHAPAGLMDAHTNFFSRVAIRVDGKRMDGDPTEGMQPDAGGSYTFSVPLTVDRHGLHTVSVSASDRFGRSASSSIDFTVASVSREATLTVDAPEGFVRDVAEFDAQADRSLPSGRLIVTDSRGSTVLSRPDVTLPYTWDLRDSEGTPVPDGNYRATLHSTTHTTRPVSFTVIRAD